MSKYIERLINSTFYPVSEDIARDILGGRGLSPEEDFAENMRREYELAKADLYLMLSMAPSISQANFSVSISDKQREEYKRLSNAIYSKYGEQATSKEECSTIKDVSHFW